MMKKTILSVVIALAMVLSMPAAIFASDTLVKADGTPANSDASWEGGETDWALATAWDLLGDATITAASVVDPSIVIEDEKNTAADLNVIYDDTGVCAVEETRTVSADELLAAAGIQTADMNGQAPAGDPIQTSVSTSSVSASRHSGTSGSVSAYAGFNKKATKATCTITLQEKYNGSWRNATGLPVTIYKKTVYDSYSISAAKTFTLKSGKTYRAKIGFVDTNSSGTYYKTRYTGAF
ncbi:MAG: hypothetical protein Q4C25_04575 [Bacillota bacterium]|nr:hypothetical protein [Bacillota bacterium]